MKSYGADQMHSKCPISYEAQLGFIAKEPFVAKVMEAQRLQAKSPDLSFVGRCRAAGCPQIWRPQECTGVLRSGTGSIGRRPGRKPLAREASPPRGARYLARGNSKFSSVASITTMPELAQKSVLGIAQSEWQRCRVIKKRGLELP
jgi:hypothetical protein